MQCSPDFRRAVLSGEFPGFDRLSSSHRGEPGSITGQSIWDFSRTNWHCDRFPS